MTTEDSAAAFAAHCAIQAGRFEATAWFKTSALPGILAHAAEERS